MAKTTKTAARRPRKRSLMSLETATDTGRVLAWRLPMLAIGMVNPTASRQAETIRMVAEKQQAMVDGAIGAQVAFWSAMTSSMMSGSFDFARVSVEVSDAAHAPTLKTLGANARRVSRRRTY